jgi:hypothetical protein
MSAVADDRSSYVIRERSMRARYADVVGVRLAVPFDLELAGDFLDKTIKLIGPVARYVQQAEAAWLWTRPPGMVTVTQPGERFPLHPPPSA